MIRKFVRWLLNKDELEAIKDELLLMRLLIKTEIERQSSRHNYPVGPLRPVEKK
jgi:hypothetical protein